MSNFPEKLASAYLTYLQWPFKVKLFWQFVTTEDPFSQNASKYPKHLFAGLLSVFYHVYLQRNSVKTIYLSVFVMRVYETLATWSYSNSF